MECQSVSFEAKRPDWLDLPRLIDAIAGGVLALDGEGRVVYANDAALSLLGLRAEDTIGALLSSVVGSEYADGAQEQVEQVLAGHVAAFECRARGGAAPTSWVRVSLTPAGVDVAGAVGVLSDVSSERRTERKLHDVEERLRSVAAHTPGIIFELRYFRDGSAHLEYVSEASQRYTGLSPRKLTGGEFDFSRVIHPDDLEHVVTCIENSVRTLEPDTVEFRVVAGEVTHHMVAEYSIEAGPNGSGILSGVAIDVDDLKSSETKYRASQAQLHAVFDSLPFACWTLNQEERFVLQNPPSEKRWGDVIGKTIAELDIDPDYLSAWEQDVSQAFAGEPSRRNLVLHEDGVEIHIRRLIVPIRDEDSVIGVVGVSVDTTEQRRLEKQIAQTQKLDAIGRLAGGIAHDFNNLLTAIMSCVRLLERRLEGPPRRELQIIRDGAQRAAELTRQLLAFAKQEMVEPRRSSIDEIVTKSDRLLRRLIGEDIDLQTKADSGGIEVIVDPVRLEQAIINLVVNARDAMPKGGTLSVRCESVELSESATSVDGAIPPGHYAHLIVEDEGVGMNEETRQRAFEPFFTTRQESGGTGLGLSSVYGSVHQADGFVTLESTPGVGTKVGLFIPVATPPESPLEEESSGPHATITGGTETILVVEDEPLVMSVAAQSLRMGGYTVLKARSPRLAMEVAKRHDGPIDLLLTDVIMPHGRGPELAASLRETRPDIAVLYMSGYTSERTEIDAKSEEFLAKPFTPDALDTRVRAILDARKRD